jgi:hypothetical protein
VLTGEGANADRIGADFVAENLVAAADFILTQHHAR